MPEELLASARELVRQLRWVDVVDVTVVSALFYGAISWLRRAQSRFVVRGLAGAVALYFVARLLGMHLTLFIFQAALTVAVVALVVIFQEDIRRAFERIAVRARLGNPKAAPPWERTVRLVCRVATQLADSRTGSLIIFPGREPLDRHLTGGVELHGELSEPLLLSIFDPSSPGHDGGLVIHLGAVDRFGVHLPLSTQPQAEQRGTRHAAALGLAERSDALVVVVSEETGTISLAVEGQLLRFNADVVIHPMVHHHRRPVTLRPQQPQAQRAKPRRRTEGEQCVFHQEFHGPRHVTILLPNRPRFQLRPAKNRRA